MFSFGFPVDSGDADTCFIIKVRRCPVQYHSYKIGNNLFNVNKLRENSGAEYVFARVQQDIQQKYRFQFEVISEISDNVELDPENIVDEGDSDGAACALAIHQTDVNNDGLLVLISCSLSLQEKNKGLVGNLLERVTGKATEEGEAKKSLQNKWTVACRNKALALVLHQDDATLLSQKIGIEPIDIRKFKNLLNQGKEEGHPYLVSCRSDQLADLAEALGIDSGLFLCHNKIRRKNEKDWYQSIQEHTCQEVKRTRKYNPQTYVPSENLDAEWNEFLSSDSIAFPLIGEGESGKTCFLCYQAEELLKKGYPVLYIHQINDGKIVEEIFRKTGGEKMAEISAGGRPPVLMIDSLDEYRDIDKITFSEALLQVISFIKMLRKGQFKVVFAIRSSAYCMLPSAIKERIDFSDISIFYQINRKKENCLKQISAGIDGAMGNLHLLSDQSRRKIDVMPPLSQQEREEIYERNRKFYSGERNPTTSYSELSPLIKEKLKFPGQIVRLLETFHNKQIPYDAFGQELFERYLLEKIYSEKQAGDLVDHIMECMTKGYTKPYRRVMMGTLDRRVRDYFEKTEVNRLIFGEDGIFVIESGIQNRQIGEWLSVQDDLLFEYLFARHYIFEVQNNDKPEIVWDKLWYLFGRWAENIEETIWATAASYLLKYHFYQPSATCDESLCKFWELIQESEKKDTLPVLEKIVQTVAGLFVEAPERYHKIVCKPNVKESYKFELAVTKECDDICLEHAKLGSLGFVETAWKKIAEQLLEIYSLHQNCLPIVEGLTSIYNNLGFWMQRQLRFMEAEKHYKLAIDLLNPFLLSDFCLREININLVRVYSNMGTIQERQGNIDGAEISYRQVIAIYEKCLQKNLKIDVDWLFALGYLKLGNLLWKKREIDLAEHNFRKALEVTNKETENWGLLNIICVLYKNLGIIKEDLGKWQEAEENLQKAEEFVYRTLKMMGKQSGILKDSVMSELGSIYNVLGNVQLKKGEIFLSEKYHLQALEILKTVYQKQHQKTNDTMEYLCMAYVFLAVFQMSQQRWEQAEENFHNAIEILFPYQQTHSLFIEEQLVSIHINLGTIKENQYQIEKAKENFRKAIYFFELYFCNKKFCNINILESIAEVYYSLGLSSVHGAHLAQAEADYQNAVDILESLYSSHPENFHAAELLAKTLYSLEGFKKFPEERNYQRIVEILEPLYDKHQERLDIAESLGRIFYQLGGLQQKYPEQMQKSYQKAVDSLEPVYSKYPENLEIAVLFGDSCYRLGVLQDNQEQLLEAKKNYQRAMETLEVVYSKHPENIRAAETLATVCNDLGFLLGGDLAKNCYSKAIRILESVCTQSKTSKFLILLAVAYRNLGEVQISQHFSTEGYKNFYKGIDIFNSLNETELEPIEIMGFANSYIKSGMIHCEQNQKKHAKEDYKKAVEILSNLCRRKFGNDFVSDFEHSFKGLQEKRQAEEYFKKAMEMFKLLCREYPENSYLPKIISNAVDNFSQMKSLNIVHVNKIGRNDPCPCGSGKKYKRCCGK